MIHVTLDLHGKTHKEAEEEVQASLLAASIAGSFDMDIITGNSDAMKNIVKEICNNHNFNYHYPVLNSGMMTVSYFKL